MRRVWRSLLAALVLLVLTWAGLRAASPSLSERPEREAGRGEPGETEDIEGRVRDYLRRHGDQGQIDPERQLKRVAAEYERYRKEMETRRRFPAGIGGTDWISLGPTNGAGRMTAIAPYPGGSSIAYAGAAGGGVWKTTDGGASWVPLTEGLHDLSVGALALAPSNPSIVYLGTGEGGNSPSFIPGIGFLKSLDGGASWILPSSVLATNFYRILVHPTDANELVAGTNAGGFRSQDGGATWTNVISTADYGDVADMVRDPTDPRVLYAATWCRTFSCTFLTPHVLRSADGGVTWTDRSTGLDASRGSRSERASIAISPSNPQILYTASGVFDLFDTGSLFCHISKSTDGGANWSDLTSVSGNPAPAINQYMGGQVNYDNTLVVSPIDPSIVIAGGIGVIRSTDAGATFSLAFTTGSDPPHADCHDLRYQGTRLWIANDGGIWTSDDDGKTATSHNSGLVTRQYYAIATDPTNRQNIIAGSQDNGTVARIGATTSWSFIGGGDGIGCAIHPLSPSLAWISFQGGNVLRTRTLGSGTAPPFAFVSPPFEDDERRSFYTVVKLDPREPLTLYTASTRLWKSRDGGDTWRPLPTSTSDGSTWATGFSAGIVSVALPSSSSPNMIVAKAKGVFRSLDAGETWAAGQGLPNAVVNNVTIDPRDPSIAYACIATTLGPSVYRSMDAGLTWTPIANGLPPFAAQVLRVDPTDSSDLFCGTDIGVFRSTDRGATWARFGTNLPSTSIHDLEILPDGSLLRAGTYGRGIWELVVPPTGNTPPTASITSPPGAITVMTGASVAFAGTVTDPDAGDAVNASWFFPDDVTTVPAGGTVQHVFRHGGNYPVALAAQDSHGARSSAAVIVSVRETFDACATPAVIPGAGPFPYTLSWNDEAGTTESTDPMSSCFASLGRAGSAWFEFTPATGGDYALATCTSASTVISVFTGPACGPYTPVPMHCNAIGGDTSCGGGGTSATVTLQAGQTVRIQTGGVQADSLGAIQMTIAPSGASPDGFRVDRVGDWHGSVSGGNLVVIAGGGFVDGTTVSFGGVPATEVAVLGNGVITARSPPHAAGPVDVAVIVPGVGTATLHNGFYYEVIQVTAREAPATPQKRPPSRRVDPRPPG